MPGILENWSFPIRTFFQRLFGREGGIIPTGPKWSDVIDPNSITGNPPDLNTDTIVVDGYSSPFSVSIIKEVHIGIKRYSNNQLYEEMIAPLREDQLPYLFDFARAGIDDRKLYNRKDVFTIESIP